MKLTVQDIKDWQDLKQGTFKKNPTEVNLKDVLDQLKTLMEHEAEIS